MKTRLLAVASAGGHWVQLLRLRPAFGQAETVWLTTQRDYASDVQGPLHVVQDANLWTKWALAKMFLQVGWFMVRIRPDVVVTTGAAPGLAAIIFGRALGARTIWIDSIANSEELSSSGTHAGRFAHVWLTQWEHLARPSGPQYCGAVL
jgi:hypothetical protein